MRTAADNVGRFIVALAAIWLLASLFMPWYGLELNRSFYRHNSFVLIFFTGKNPVDGWQTLSALDIYLAVVGGARALGLRQKLARTGRTLFGATSITGLVAVGMITYRLIEPALQVDDSSLNGFGGSGQAPNISVQPRIGIVVALASAMTILIGSILVSFGSWPIIRFLAPGNQGPPASHAAA